MQWVILGNVELTDVAVAKALANPVRQRILRELDTLGEATSTLLAERLGITTGGTSYNLRVLAQHGFVEEVPERARGRERWWRSTEQNFRLPVRSSQPPELRAAIERLNEVWFTEDVEAFARFQEVRESLGAWADAVPYSRGQVRLTLQELMSFFEEYLALLGRYQRAEEDTPEGARTLLTRFLAFPDISETEG